MRCRVRTGGCVGQPRSCQRERLAARSTWCVCVWGGGGGGGGRTQKDKILVCLASCSGNAHH